MSAKPRHSGLPVGRWRITDMDKWDADVLDLVVPAFIEFQRDGTGSFRCIAVEGWIDYRVSDEEERARVESTWEGNDECDPGSGRGWAIMENDGSMVGHIFLHLGEDSAFQAVRLKDA